MKSNFRRSHSKVWWGNDEQSRMFQHGKSMYNSFNRIDNDIRNMSAIMEDSRSSPEVSIIQRRDSPGSLRSQDSGFSDSDHSSPNSSNNSNHAKVSPADANRNYLKASPNKLSPKLKVDYQINAANRSFAERSPSLCSEVPTPPTVIRKQPNLPLSTMTARRISFSAPSSPSSQAELPLTNFTSMTELHSNTDKNNNNDNNGAPMIDGNLADVSVQSNRSTNKANRSLRRGRTVTPENGESYRRLSQRKLLRCVSQVSGSVDDVYTLSTSTTTTLVVASTQPAGDEHIYETVASVSGRSPQKAEQQTPKRSATAKVAAYNNETVVFGTDIESSSQKPSPASAQSNERLPLPTYDELYPNGTSTPKLMSRNHHANGGSARTPTIARSSLAASGAATTTQTPSANRTNNSILNRIRNGLFSGEMDLSMDLSLSAAINWETCTYIEYTNPLLNGHASSVQFWLDETRAAYCHEILSTLQTKSVLHEAARSLKLNAAIAAKLIHQIQLKAMHIEGNFDEVESVFVSHARASRGVQHYDAAKDAPAAAANDSTAPAYLDEDQFKDIIPNLVKQLISNVCLFMSKLNSRVIFQAIDGAKNEPGELKKFEKSVKIVVEMSQDLQVACDTKIDDIEAHKLLEDLQSLKHCVLKIIRQIYRRLVNIIITRIESNTNELLLRASVNLISALPLEGHVYNRADSFASLSKAFLDTGAMRVLLLVCLDTEQTTIRTMALRALATICASSDVIEQFVDMGGVDVVADLLMDERKTGDKFDMELREAISVLTQVTAPWHLESHVAIDDFLRVSVDKVVTRITALLEQTDDLQMFLLCAACLNNLSQKTDLTFYSLMSNRSVLRIKDACDTLARQNEFANSRVFLYEQITTMMFHMAGNKKCHQHLANKEIINFITHIFQSQFHMKYNARPESIAKMKSIKNILHIFARLLHHSAVGHDILQNNVIPIFSHVEQNLNADSAYSRDIMYINRKLNRSISPSGRGTGQRLFGNHIINNNDIGPGSSTGGPSTLPRRNHVDQHRHKLILDTMSPTNSLESYV